MRDAAGVDGFAFGAEGELVGEGGGGGFDYVGLEGELAGVGAFVIHGDADKDAGKEGLEVGVEEFAVEDAFKEGDEGVEVEAVFKEVLGYGAVDESIVFDKAFVLEELEEIVFVQEEGGEPELFVSPPYQRPSWIREIPL